MYCTLSLLIHLLQFRLFKVITSLNKITQKQVHPVQEEVILQSPTHKQRDMHAPKHPRYQSEGRDWMEEWLEKHWTWGIRMFRALPQQQMALTPLSSR